MSQRLSSHYYKHRAERRVGSWMGANALMVCCSVRHRSVKERCLSVICMCAPPPTLQTCSFSYRA